MPLTGEPITDPSETRTGPALVVKIDNIAPARPQTGLNEADIVFEEIVNEAHPVRRRVPLPGRRPGRPDPLRPPPGHRDARVVQPPAVRLERRQRRRHVLHQRSELVDLSANHTSGYYRRSGGGAVEPVHLEQAMWSHRPADFYVRPGVLVPPPGEQITNGQPATTIKVTMDNIDVRWECDAGSGKYFRSQDGGHHRRDTARCRPRTWC